MARLLVFPARDRHCPGCGAAIYGLGPERVHCDACLVEIAALWPATLPPAEQALLRRGAKGASQDPGGSDA